MAAKGPTIVTPKISKMKNDPEAKKKFFENLLESAT